MSVLLWILLLQDVDLLVERLGAETFAERREAVEALVRRGRKAVPALEKAATSGDPEVQLRAREALARILGDRLLEWRREGRAAALARGGGSAETEAAVQAALRWLARHQGPDGGWTAAGSCAGCRAGEPTSDADTGVTGLAVLAFLAAGETGDVPRRGLRRLVEIQDGEGCVGPRGEKHLYGHTIAALALAEGFAMTEDEEWRAPAQKAGDFTAAAQNPGKGWRYASRCGDTDTSVTFWATLSLRMAREAGLRVAPDAFAGARSWLDDVTGEAYFRVGYTHRLVKQDFNRDDGFDRHESMTALAVTMRLLTGEDGSSPAVERGADLLIRDKPSAGARAVDYYYWHAATLALHRQDGPGGKRWTSWNEALKAALLPLQRREGCPAGAWDPAGRYGMSGGRAYPTALNALTLQTYTRYRLPR